MKHNVEVSGHGHARHQREPRQTFTDFHLQEEVNASCLLSTTTTCSSQLDTGGREQAATHTPLRTRSACKVDAHGRAHRLPSSNQLFVISARASEPSHEAASTSLSVCSSRESASNAACSRQLVFPYRDAPLRHAPLHTHPYMEQDSTPACSVCCHHWTHTATTKQQRRHDLMEGAATFGDLITEKQPAGTRPILNPAVTCGTSCRYLTTRLGIPDRQFKNYCRWSSSSTSSKNGTSRSWCQRIPRSSYQHFPLRVRAWCWRLPAREQPTRQILIASNLTLQIGAALPPTFEDPLWRPTRGQVSLLSVSRADWISA